MHIEELLRTIDKNRKLADHGRGLDRSSITRCQQCERPTVAEEHSYTPQRTLLGEERETTYYTCEWCGAEVTPGAMAPKKPAQTARGDEDYWSDMRRSA
jgi:DNA-directed RNA polymerase subunit M/transcription elongation factor TFIIS